MDASTHSTDVSPSTPRQPQICPVPGSLAPRLVLVLFFLLLIASQLVVQTFYELRQGKGIQALDVFRQKPTARNLRNYEHNLEDASVTARWLRPWFQFGQFAWLRDGGTKAVVGNNHWLFYRPGYDALLTQSINLSVGTNDPLPAILNWRDALAARGIRLLMLPVPNKESVYPDRLTSRFSNGKGLRSPATREFLERLKLAGVEYIDLFSVFDEARHKQEQVSLYLAQDSHWSPAGLAMAAQAVADRLVQLDWIQRGQMQYQVVPKTLQRFGDVLEMLHLPMAEQASAPESVLCQQVAYSQSVRLYQDELSAQVLILGDSFLRIFQHDEPGSAGFIAHLARELKQPMSSLVSDGGASTLVRQELFRRPALLEHKRVLIWEFVERDIQLGTEGWQIVPLPEPTKP